MGQYEKFYKRPDFSVTAVAQKKNLWQFLPRQIFLFISPINSQMDPNSPAETQLVNVCLTKRTVRVN